MEPRVNPNPSYLDMYKKVPIYLRAVIEGALLAGEGSGIL